MLENAGIVLASSSGALATTLGFSTQELLFTAQGSDGTIQAVSFTGTAATTPTISYFSTASITATGTTTLSGTGTLNIGGHNLVTGDVGKYVVINDQADPTQNGTYSVTAVSASGGGTWTPDPRHSQQPDDLLHHHRAGYGCVRHHSLRHGLARHRRPHLRRGR